MRPLLILVALFLNLMVLGCANERPGASQKASVISPEASAQEGGMLDGAFNILDPVETIQPLASVRTYVGEDYTLSTNLRFNTEEEVFIRWFKDGLSLDYADGRTELPFQSADLGDDGTYQIQIYIFENGVEKKIYQKSARVEILPASQRPSAAQITQPIRDQRVTARVGETVTLEVETIGTPAPTIQWFKNGVELGGQTQSTLNLSNLQLSDAGAFSARATNRIDGSLRPTMSANFNLEVEAAPNGSGGTDQGGTEFEPIPVDPDFPGTGIDQLKAPTPRYASPTNSDVSIRWARMEYAYRYSVYVNGSFYRQVNPGVTNLRIGISRYERGSTLRFFIVGHDAFGVSSIPSSTGTWIVDYDN